jgi:hypothetical protein
MKRLHVIATLVMVLLLGFATTCLAYEASVFNPVEGWIIRAYTEGTGSPFTVKLEVLDTDNAYVPATTIAGLATGSNPIEISPDAVSEDISLSFDEATSTAYVFYRDKNGNLALTPVPNLMKARPIINVVSEASSFGIVDKGDTRTKTVTINNIGTVDLNIGTTEYTGAGFSIVSDTCAGTKLAPTTVISSENCVITVEFTPTASGSYSGILTINSDDQKDPSHKVDLAATGAAANISVAPNTLSFGSATLNATAEQTVTVSNTGTANLTLGPIGVTGEGFGIVRETCSEVRSLAPNTQTCTITVGFTPTDGIPYTGTLTIPSNTSNGQPVTIALSGSGNGKPDLVITSVSAPCSINNGQYFSMTVTIANNGTVPSGAFTVKAWISVDTIPNNGGRPSDYRLLTWDVDNVDAGKTLTKTIGGCVFRWFNIHATYYIVAQVDSENNVAESDENNNVMTAPDLVNVAR